MNIIDEAFYIGAINRSNRDELYSLYTNQRRHYHNLNHIDKMWKAYNDMCRWHNLVPAKGLEIMLAILYHDCVFDPNLPKFENEKRSAQKFMEHFKDRADEDLLTLVMSAIHKTGNHFESPVGLMTDSIIETLMFLDIMELAAPFHVFKENHFQIIDEYCAFGFKYPEVYEGRKKFLLDLNNKIIFDNDELEEACKNNIKILYGV